jgi:cob(I)alamin adenosyltransferase
MKGYVQVYTGNGKGKTTAALGLALRACGAGLRVYIGQFIKGGDYSEIQTLKNHLPNVVIEQYGRGCFVREKPSPEDLAAARAGLERLSAALTEGHYDVVIADEACCACTAGLFECKALLQLVDRKPDRVELIFTGRDAPQALVQRADLVTEMRSVKHYFDAGVGGRRGIES